MNVTSKITVDLTRTNLGARVNAVQGDGNTRYVEITILADGKPWTPPEGVEAAIAYRQPGGTKGLYNLLADGTPAISLNDNVATIILTPQMLTVSGVVYASIVFNNAQLDQLTSFPFTVSVDRNQYAGAQKTEDYIRLQWLEDKLDEYLEKFAGGATDEAIVKRIVDEYLAENPPAVTETDPTVPAWAKQPEKPTYTAAEVGALSAETLPAAITTALAQAKDSGEFDGAPGADGNPGAPGVDGYSPTASVTQTDTGAVITITDKTGKTTAALKNGADGQPGPTGATPNIQIGTVETLEAGSPATASMDGTPENPILNLGIPQGAPGTGGGGGIAVTGATVGQTVKIAAVDDDGVPTAWEPVDFPSGGGDETSYAGELLSSGTISYETAYATVTIPVTWEKLRSYKIFVLTLSYDTNANAQFLDFEDKYGYNGIKTATIVFEWIDSAHTRARTYAYNYVSSVINKLNFAVQLFRSANIVPEIPKFIANDTDYFSFNLSTAQTTGIVYNIYGGFK